MERAGILLLVVGGVLLAIGAVFAVLIVAGVGDESSQPRSSSRTLEQSSTQPLRVSADSRRFLVGAAVTDDALKHDKQYAQTLTHEYNAVTPENAMKWATIHPDPNRYDFAPADAIVRFARAHDMTVRGHTLVWYREVPSWVTDRAWTRPELEQVLHDHIRRVVGHYRGKVAQWDVVNEAVDKDGRLRDNVWLRVIGPDYIDLAFTWAHEADPNAALYYNDYDIEFPGPKASAVHALVRRLQARRIPIDGVGIQAHERNADPPSRYALEAALRGYADLGLDVAITELDVRVQLPASDEKLKEQAKIYTDVLDACLAVSRCRTLVTWGLTDKYSWVPAEIPGFGAALPFDAAYQPKPALIALRKGLAGGGG